MSLAVPVVPQIAHTRDPRLPHLSFEWHAYAGKVYVVLLPGRYEDGQWLPAPPGSKAEARCIAEHCEDRGRFLSFVQTWLRGYRHAKDEVT